MAVYSVATGALAPVLSKLSALLGDEHLDLAERTRSDAMFIRSQLEALGNDGGGSRCFVQG